MRLFHGILGCLVLFLLVAPAVPSHASDARLDGLAVQYEYMEDFILYRFFPTVTARYGNLVTATLGSRNAETGAFDEARSIGFIGSADKSKYGNFAVFLNNVGQDAQFDLGWAKQFPGVALGLNVLWQNSSYEFGDVERSPKDGLGLNGQVQGTNQFSVTGGVNLDVSDTGQLEAAVEVASLYWKFTGPHGGVISEDAGHLSYRITARMRNEINSRTKLVPLFNFSRVDLTPDGAAEDHYVSSLNFGVAMHHEVHENDLFILGLAANYRQSQFGAGADKVSRWDLPALFAAMEFGLTDWMTARVGATKTLDVINVEAAADALPDQDRIESRYIFGLGAGFHFENFDLDLTLNPDDMFKGGYVVSGEETRLFTRITGTYYF